MSSIADSALGTGKGLPWGPSGQKGLWLDSPEGGNRPVNPNDPDKSKIPAGRSNPNDPHSANYVKPVADQVYTAPSYNRTGTGPEFRNNTAEEDFRNSLMNSVNRNYGFNFQGIQNPAKAISTAPQKAV